jgi:hypothetical protein
MSSCGGLLTRLFQHANLSHARAGFRRTCLETCAAGFFAARLCFKAGIRSITGAFRLAGSPFNCFPALHFDFGCLPYSGSAWISLE